MANYPNSGALNRNKYKEPGDKKPDWTGSIKMDRSVLRTLMNETDQDEIEIKLSGWDMNGSYGPFTRLAWNNYKPKPKDEPMAEPVRVETNPAPLLNDEDIPF